MRLGLQPGTRVAFLTANRADTWCAGVAAQLSRLAITWLHPLGSLDDQLFQLEDSEARDAGGRRRDLPRPRRRACGKGDRPEDRLHARAGRLRRRPARRGRERRQRHRALLRRPRRYRDAELHRRHDRQIQGRAALSPRIWRLRQRDPRRFRNPRGAALSRGRADQPCRRHQGAADPDARRHRAHAEGF